MDEFRQIYNKIEEFFDIENNNNLLYFLLLLFIFFPFSFSLLDLLSDYNEYYNKKNGLHAI
jgi:hypothetical protein